MSSAKTNGSASRQELASSLADALQQPRQSRDGPLTTENQIAETKSVHVAVIWDRWDDLTPEERSKVIRDAYAKAKRLRGFAITAAVGVTSEEALRLGFLPYSIITTRRAGDPASLGRLSEAMAGTSGVLVSIGSATQLRFPTLEAAEDAYRQLSQQVPGPYWAIVHEQLLAE